MTVDGALVAWIAGSHRYVAKVTVNDDGWPESECTCPYTFNCKHGVAVVLEYLAWFEKDQPVSQPRADDARLELIQNGGLGDGALLARVAAHPRP
jgi:uncharacterized Zn finger protein